MSRNKLPDGQLAARSPALKNSATSQETAALLEAFPQPSLLLEDDRHIAIANAKFIALTGRPAARLRESELKSIFGDPSMVDSILNVAQSATDASVWHQAQLIQTDGQKIHVQVAATRLTAQSTLLTFHVPSAAIESPSSLTLLAAGIAHEFNNVLSVITGNIQLARASFDPKKAQRFMSEAELGCAMAAAMAERLLTIGDGHRPNPTVFDVIAETRTVLQRLAPATTRSTSTNASAKKTTIDVCADRHDFTNALTNLQKNARDASPPNGKIITTLSLTTIASPTIIASGPLEAGQYIALSVADFGHGMTDTISKRVFEPYFTTKPPGSGFGLGLAQVRAFALQSAGGVDLKSSPHAGKRSKREPSTVVSLYLPLTKPHADTAPAPLITFVVTA